MLQELKEMKKVIHEQNENIKQTNYERMKNSGAAKYNSLLKKSL